MREIELVVVGAGPAGTAAARTAARLGIQALLIDENPIDAAGVQRNVPYWYGPRAAGWAGAAGRAQRPDPYGWLSSHPELGHAVEEGVELLAGHSVWGLFADRVVGIFDGSATALLRAQQVILATGATDLHLAFEGWTLGGVLGGGGALHLLETYGFLEARRMVVVGAGNLGLEVVRRCLAADVQVVGVVEVGREPVGDRALAAELQHAGVPFYLSHTLRAARGGADVEQVVLARVDHLGPVAQVRADADVTLEADAVCVAIGRQSAIELAYLAGCAIDFDAPRGGWVPRLDRAQRTTSPGVLVAGDAAGCADAAFLDPRIAAESGERAAHSAAAALRRHAPQWVVGDASSPRTETAPSSAAVASTLAPASTWDNSAPSPELASSPDFVSSLGSAASLAATDAYATVWHRLADGMASDDVVVCRCEEVTRGQVLEALGWVDDRDVNEVKRISRAGMGVCQGRGCRPIVAGLLASRSGCAFADVPLGSYRPPVRPLPLAALATEAAPPSPGLLLPFEEAEERLSEEVRAGRLGPLALMRFRRQAEEASFSCTRDELSAADTRRIAADLERGIRLLERRDA